MGKRAFWCNLSDLACGQSDLPTFALGLFIKHSSFCLLPGLLPFRQAWNDECPLSLPLRWSYGDPMGCGLSTRPGMIEIRCLADLYGVTGQSERPDHGMDRKCKTDRLAPKPNGAAKRLFEKSRRNNKAGNGPSRPVGEETR